jgi:hypothetical protein
MAATPQYSWNLEADGQPRYWKLVATSFCKPFSYLYTILVVAEELQSLKPKSLNLGRDITIGTRRLVIWRFWRSILTRDSTRYSKHAYPLVRATYQTHLLHSPLEIWQNPQQDKNPLILNDFFYKIRVNLHSKMLKLATFCSTYLTSINSYILPLSSMNHTIESCIIKLLGMFMSSTRLNAYWSFIS